MADAVHRIEDITPNVKKWNEQRKNGRLSLKDIPTEKLYKVEDIKVRKRLDMK